MLTSLHVSEDCHFIGGQGATESPKEVTIEPQHEISNNVVCAISKAADLPALMRSLIRAFASRLNIP